MSEKVKGLHEAYASIYEINQDSNPINESSEQLDEINVGKVAGGALGGALGAVGGPLGALAGGYLGSKAGEGFSRGLSGGNKPTKPAPTKPTTKPTTKPAPTKPTTKPTAAPSTTKPSSTSTLKPAQAKPSTPATQTKPAGSAMDQWAKANPKLAAAKAERDRTRGTSATTNPLMKDMKDRLPAPKSPSPTTAKTGFDLAKKGVNLASDVDIFDLVKGYLLDEGYAETEEGATVIMVNMSEEWRKSILESCGVQLDEAQEAREKPEEHEENEKKEHEKKYGNVRGEKTPMPPRGDKRREEFEKWYAKNVR